MNKPTPHPNGARRWPIQLAVLLVCLATGSAFAHVALGQLPGWQVEQGVEIPSYAVVEPTRTDLNIDTVVLACEEAQDSKVLQLQIYLSSEGRLRPNAMGTRPFKVDPRAEISIDGRTFAADILFAEDHVVLADAQQGYFPLLSGPLLDAMQAGKTMILRFDLVAERPGQAADFDGEAVIDLRSGAGRAAIAAVRRCAEPATARPVRTALARD